VSPSQEIETRVQAEIRKADASLARMDAAALFDSPYLVSAIFYRDGFLSRYPADKLDGDPARRIISHLSRQLTPARKQEFIARLKGRYGWRDVSPPRPGIVQPVPYKASPRPPRTRRTHQNALDLFAREGTPVRSAAGGVVLLAENGWNEQDPFSTSSHAGGNTVITFEPATGRFYRYCHLETAGVAAGQEVEPGQVLGSVGHSGLNASRPRHGGHLHFEMNQWTGEEMRVLVARDLWDLLRLAK
jgi:murein DD-endopeptidase MepM/ murein hydrolase activator NlpD